MYWDLMAPYGLLNINLAERAWTRRLLRRAETGTQTAPRRDPSAAPSHRGEHPAVSRGGQAPGGEVGIRSEDDETTLRLLHRGLEALQRRDWDRLREVCSPDVVWRVPGRGPFAGELLGVDALIARWKLAPPTGGPRVTAVMATRRVGVVVQQLAVPDADPLSCTVLTLCTVTDERVTRLQTFYADQYAVDAYQQTLASRQRSCSAAARR